MREKADFRFNFCTKSSGAQLNLLSHYSDGARKPPKSPALVQNAPSHSPAGRTYLKLNSSFLKFSPGLFLTVGAVQLFPRWDGGTGWLLVFSWGGTHSLPEAPHLHQPGGDPGGLCPVVPFLSPARVHF